MRFSYCPESIVQASGTPSVPLCFVPSAARHLAYLLCLALVSLLCGCSKKASPAYNLGPQEVLVTDVIKRDVPVVREWIGSLDGSVNADIRARISGYVVSQNYKEGTLGPPG